ncbi:putative nucleoside-diphosphate-sugar epimerase protein [Neofusicoccum parvum UCRNP2]|uniref:Putative nucleoside-diphosphate-sugar epimerase protein n=1 Tax=Botryosphaeria parva (strain UCR-NP2) TaxID=1287680 RepID=R1G6L1_BOTPV|nr:putative nucleoside-diphosphate-sugar epimerase protein [Neofusicoccum parvum UCRNP2]
MPPKILLTGTTGYIGGSVLHTLYAAHPTYAYTVLLRTVPPSFPHLYPAARIIHGDYDDLATLTAAAADADIVVHAGNSDHAPSLRAILDGLTQNPQPGKPRFLIHLSGTGLVSDWRRGPYGAPNPRVHSDADAFDFLTDAPLHGETEELIRQAWAAAESSPAGSALRTAVVRPPDIYGRGLGPGRKASYWVPWFVREVLGGPGEEGVGAAFYVGEGANSRGWVGLEDVARLYLLLVEAAAERGGDGAGWGREGYYHAASQEATQLELAEAVGRILYEKGLIREKEPKQVPLERVDRMIAALGVPLIARYLFASNARSSAERSRKMLGWEPKAPSLWEVLEQDVMDAVEAMGDKAYFRLA